MKVLAQRIGGSGHAGGHLSMDFADGHIPHAFEGHPLKPATLNLILEVGTCFKTPTRGGATKSYVAGNGETYFLQAIHLRVMPEQGQHASEWLPGFIHRNRPHPAEFDNVIEIIAPDITAYLRAGKKEWFELDGPFEAATLVRPKE